jgi:hypothetical protein
MQFNQEVTVTNNNDKRSSTKEMKAIVRHQQGVGARHPYTPLCGEGGRYLDTCTEPVFFEKNFKKSEDQRINELREMGLGYKWLQIAETIGFDNFMSIWAILDADNINNSDIPSERVRIWVPTFNRYLRYQRNRYILARAADKDANPDDIKKEIRKLLGESLSLAHIKKIMGKVNI